MTVLSQPFVLWPSYITLDQIHSSSGNLTW